MKIIFCKSNSIGGQLIRLFTWSEWSHVGVVFDDVVYEAVGSGVRKVPLDEVLRHYHQNCTILNVDVPDEAASRRFLEAQLGKPYDYSAIISFVSQRDWAEDDKWFCSELTETAILMGGRLRFREKMNRITPQHVWMVTV